MTRSGNASESSSSSSLPAHAAEESNRPRRHPHPSALNTPEGEERTPRRPASDSASTQAESPQSEDGTPEDGCPRIIFDELRYEPGFEQGTRSVTVTARVVGAAGQEVEARLRDASSGLVLDVARDPDGRLELSHQARYVTGSYAVYAEIVTPEACGGKALRFHVPSVEDVPSPGGSSPSGDAARADGRAESVPQTPAGEQAHGTGSEADAPSQNILDNLERKWAESSDDSSDRSQPQARETAVNGHHAHRDEQPSTRGRTAAQDAAARDDVFDERSAVDEAAPDEDDSGGAAPASWKTRLVGAAWLIGLTFYLFAIAVEMPRLLITAGTSVMIPMGAYFLWDVPTHWAKWTLRSVGLFGFAIVLLLPYANPIQPSDDLLASGLVSSGLVIGAAIIWLRNDGGS
jgi:hypothetical protein